MNRKIFVHSEFLKIFSQQKTELLGIQIPWRRKITENSASSFKLHNSLEHPQKRICRFLTKFQVYLIIISRFFRSEVFAKSQIFLGDCIDHVHSEIILNLKLCPKNKLCTFTQFKIWHLHEIYIGWSSQSCLWFIITSSISTFPTTTFIQH